MLPTSDSLWVLWLVGAVTLVYLLKRYGFGGKKLTLPPGPRNLPVIGAMKDVKPPLHRAFERLAAKYGPIVHFRLGAQTLVVVSSPEVAEEVLKHKDLELADRLTTMNRSAARYAGFEAASLSFCKYDAQTKLVRKVLNKDFFTVAKLKEHEEIRTEDIVVMVEKISGLISSIDQSGIVGIRAAACLRQQHGFLQERIKIATKPNMVDYFPSRILDPQGLLKELRKMEKRQMELCGEVLEEYKRLTDSNRSSERSARNLVDVLLQVQEQVLAERSGRY